MNFLTPADLIAEGLNLPLPEEPPAPLPEGTTCALTGQPITAGYAVSTITTSATSEFLDHFRAALHGHVSVNAARCYMSANPRTGNPCARSLAAFPGVCHQPLIARESAATEGRPCWSDLLRAVAEERWGQPCLLLVTTDTKKRLWPRARVGTVGARTPVYLYDSPGAENGILWVDIARLARVLGVIEAAYTAGYSKRLIRRSLLAGAATPEALAHERALAPTRGTPEFRVAVLVAQKAAAP